MLRPLFELLDPALEVFRSPQVPEVYHSLSYASGSAGQRFLRCQAGASDFGTEAWCSRRPFEFFVESVGCIEQPAFRSKRYNSVQHSAVSGSSTWSHESPRLFFYLQNAKTTYLPRGWWGSFCQCIPRILAKLMPPVKEIQTAGIQALEAVTICTRLLHPKAATSQTKVLTNSQYKHVIGQPVACSYASCALMITDGSPASSHNHCAPWVGQIRQVLNDSVTARWR